MGRRFPQHDPEADIFQHVSAGRKINALLPTFSHRSRCSMRDHVSSSGERSHDRCLLAERELITKAPTDGILAVRHGEPAVKQGAPGYDIALEALQQCAEAIDRLASIPIPEVENKVFRLRPKYPKPCRGRRQAVGMDAGSRSIDKFSNTQGRRDGGIVRSKTFLKMQPQISQDGPLVKQLYIAQIKGKGKGKREGDATTKTIKTRRSAKEATAGRRGGCSRRQSASK